MKVVKIVKSYNAGNKEHYITVDETLGKDYVEEMVNEWCEWDVAGMNYGYTATWEYVEDPEKINEIINKRVKMIENEIENLKNEKMKLEWSLILYKKDGK